MTYLYVESIQKYVVTIEHLHATLFKTSILITVTVQ